MNIENVLIDLAKDSGIEKLVVGGIIRNNKGEYLILSRKKDDFMGGIDEIPSGNIEKGETLFEALRREVFEETGLEVDGIELYVDYFDYISASGKKSRQYNFVVSVKNTENVKLTEHESFMWQSKKECDSNKKITHQTKTTLTIADFNLKNCR